MARGRNAPDTPTPNNDALVNSNNTPVNSDAKIKNQTFTGDAPVDTYVPHADTFEVVTLFNKVYSTTLNQSNVE